MSDSKTVVLYRIVRTNPPTASDAASIEALGRHPRGRDPEVMKLWKGISLFDSFQRAKSQAQRRPWHGDAFIATLELPTGAFQVESTRSRGHFTLWGDPHDILHFVQHVERA